MWKFGESGKWEQIWEVIARTDFSESAGKPLESVELKSAMIRLIFYKNLSGYCVETRLWRGNDGSRD